MGFRSLILSHGGTKIFRTTSEGTRFHILDIGSLEVETKEYSERAIYRIAADPKNPIHIYALFGDRIALFSEGTESEIRSWPFCEKMDTFDFAFGVKAGGDYMVAVVDRRSSYIRVANINSGASLGHFPIPSIPTRIQFSSDGRRLYALGSQGTLSIIDLNKRMQSSALICSGA